MARFLSLIRKLHPNFLTEIRHSSIAFGYFSNTKSLISIHTGNVLPRGTSKFAVTEVFDKSVKILVSIISNINH
jgi:hypothetical protein